MPKIPGLPAMPGLSDVLHLLEAQTQALVALPDTIKSLNRSVKSLATTIASAQTTAQRIEAMAVRVEDLLEEFEAPLRALAPGLRKLAAALEAPGAPDIEDVLGRLTDMQAHVANIAASTDRIMKMVDETSARIGSLPGAARIASAAARRRTPKP